MQDVVRPELERATAAHEACAHPLAILQYAELISCTASGGPARAAPNGTQYPFRTVPWPNEEEMKRSRFGVLFARDEEVRRVAAARAATAAVPSVHTVGVGRDGALADGDGAVARVAPVGASDAPSPKRQRVEEPTAAADESALCLNLSDSDDDSS